MAYDEALADRVREVIEGRSGVSERKMFGALAWLVEGNMACGVIGDDLLVRLDREDRAAALAEQHTRPFEMRGGEARGFVLVAPEGVAEDDELVRWVECGADYAASLPPK